MNYLRGLIRFICTFAVVISVYYTVISLAIVFFIATGTLREGGPMWIDIDTPSLESALLKAGIWGAIMAVFAYARHKLDRAARA